MNSDFQTFLGARLPFAGLAAWGARYPDRTLAQRCFTSWLTPAQVEQAMIQLAAAADSFSQQDLQPVQQCWTFERLRIYLAPRRDGSGLTLFVENRGEVCAAAEKVLEDFLNAAVLEGL